MIIPDSPLSDLHLGLSVHWGFGEACCCRDERGCKYRGKWMCNSRELHQKHWPSQLNAVMLSRPTDEDTEHELHPPGSRVTEALSCSHFYLCSLPVISLLYLCYIKQIWEDVQWEPAYVNKALRNALRFSSESLHWVLGHSFPLQRLILVKQFSNHTLPCLWALVSAHRPLQTSHMFALDGQLTGQQ